MQKPANWDMIVPPEWLGLGEYLIWKRCQSLTSTLYMEEVAFLWLRNSEGVRGT